MEYGQNIYGKYYLELDNTLDVLAIGVGILGGEVDGLANPESDCLLGLSRRTSVTWESSTIYMEFSSCISMESFKQTHLAHARERPEQEPARSK